MATDVTLAQPTKKLKRGYAKHGLTTLKKAVRVLGGRAIDRRTALGRALEDWRHSIIQDLGGMDQTSTQQRQVIDLAVKTKLILDSIDSWLVKQPSLVNARRRTVYSVVLQRGQIADSLARYMVQLGLERRAKVLPSLSEYLNGSKPPKPSTGKTPEPSTTSQGDGTNNAGGPGESVQEVQHSKAGDA